MRKHLKKYLIPHEENQYKPHLLREVAVSVIAFIAVGAFAASLLQSGILVKTERFLASVLPPVLVDLTNEDRADNNLPSLKTSSVLTEAARQKAEHMAENEYFAHVSPDGVTPWHWFIQAGYSFTHAGENLAVNFHDSGDVEQAWMDSPGHRANILNGDFTEVGIATKKGTYNGQSTVYVVQLFGRPAVSQAVAAVPAPAIPTPTPTPTPEPEVAPAEIEVLPEDPEPELALEEPEVEVITETDLFVAVRNTEFEIEPTTTSEVTEPAETDIATTAPDGGTAGAEAVGLVAQTSLFERLLTQPRQLLNYFYLILGALIVLALLLAIFIEIREQHPKNVMYGILLLVLLLILMYLNRSLILSDLLIV